jgi:hypothetical protein
MVSRFTSTKRRQQRASGIALVEAMMAIGLTGLIMLALVGISMFSGRSFVAMANYVELDDGNRIAIDTITRDLRSCNRVYFCATNLLALEDYDGGSLFYFHHPWEKVLWRFRFSAGNYESTPMLTGCEDLQFHLGKRNTQPGTLDQYPAAEVNEAKVVDVSWKCYREILGVKANTEAVQTAKIVIRRQGT